MSPFLFLLCFFAPASLAKTNIIGYWGANPGGNPSTLSQLQTALSKGYNTVIYAFYDVDANGTLAQDPGSAAPYPKAAILSGGSWTYLVSLFGGQNGAAPSLTITYQQWAQNMFTNFLSLNGQYAFDGIDIDLENAWGNTPDQIECGLRYFFQLMNSYKFIVSQAPQTTAITPEVTVFQPGSWNSYVPLADTSMMNYVDIVAIQCYNNAVPFNNAAAYAMSLESGFVITGCPTCANSTCAIKLPPAMISLGWPAGPSAAPSGCPGLTGGCPYGSALTTLYNGNLTLQQTGGIMTWSIEWDQFYGWQFITAVMNINWKAAT